MKTAMALGLASVSLLLGSLAMASPSSAAGTAAHLAPSTHFVVGFNATTATEVSNAASVGVSTDMLYAGPPTAQSKLGEALAQAHMGVIDGRISTELYFWECHRTHSVAPAPSRARNSYCAHDAEPGYSTSVLLGAVDATLTSDAASPFVTALWVLDDWPAWDGGSARLVLQDIHQEITATTPDLPAICGFGATVTAPGTDGWDPSTALNYSNAGCDLVGFYNYAATTRRPSSGTGLDWSMQSLLPAMESSLDSLGWDEASTPVLGIGQAWSGRFAAHYQPGLSSSQVLTQATAFCSAGATSIAWYAWSDSGFHRATQTPVNSAVMAAGIEEGIASCRHKWSG